MTQGQLPQLVQRSSNLLLLTQPVSIICRYCCRLGFSHPRLGVLLSLETAVWDVAQAEGTEGGRHVTFEVTLNGTQSWLQLAPIMPNNVTLQGHGRTHMQDGIIPKLGQLIFRLTIFGLDLNMTNRVILLGH